MNSMSNLPVVVDVEIPVDKEGRYNLNALHKASGLGGAKAPAKWTRLLGTKELIETQVKELRLETEEACLLRKEGSNGGTWASKKLALSYAMWLGGIGFVSEILEKLTGLEEIVKALNDFEIPSDLPDMWVYAIKEEGGAVKLGISRDPEERLKQLQVGNSKKLTLVAVRKAKNRYADEKRLHADNKPYKIHGEWFDVNEKLESTGWLI